MTQDRIVFVEWMDSSVPHDRGWAARKEHARHRPARCVTAGFLLVESPDYIVVVQSVDGDGAHVAAPIAIPRKAIQRLEVLRS